MDHRDLDDNLMSLMILPYPHITAKKPYNGRAGVLKALREWHASGGSKDPSMSPLVRLRMDVSEKYNITTDDVAHSEFGMLFVSTINAIPTCYWLLSYILRDPELLEQLQEEVTHIVTTDGNTKTIDISQFSANCPLLVSAYQETMRLSSVQTGTRFVQDDAEITYTTPEGGEKTYLFKKGAVIQMPTTIAHYDKSIWGLDASEFNARRFLKSETTATKDEARLRRQAFYPFGGGKHLCPGRHLADAEILGMVTAIMLGFDVEPVSGRWVLPKKIVRFGDGIAKPDVQETPTKVVVTKKKGWEDVKWAYCVDTKVEE
jgi:cytochrome P450